MTGAGSAAVGSPPGSHQDGPPARGAGVHRASSRTLSGLVPDAHRTGCTSYSAGHTVHWIQALHTANKADVSRASWQGQIVGTAGETLTVRKPDGREVTFRNHDMVRLVAINGSGSSGAVWVNDQYAILHIESYAFSVKRDSGQSLGPCPSDTLASDVSDQQLADRLHTHGGFNVPLRRDGWWV